MFTSFGFGGLLVETAFLDLLEQTFFGDSALEALQEFLGGFPASECDANQVVSLSVGATGLRWLRATLESIRWSADIETGSKPGLTISCTTRPATIRQGKSQEAGIVEDAPRSGKGSQ